MIAQDGIRHATAAVLRTPIRQFAVPHLVVDGIFPEELIRAINANWPADGFAPEVPGNSVLHVYRRDYSKLDEFWSNFNEEVWPALVASVARRFASLGRVLFGPNYDELIFDVPLTLMQADPAYPGHSLHTHFYHCPHWAFTLLLYVDPDDVCSAGTALHRVGRDDANGTSYASQDARWLSEIAIETFKWDSPVRADRRFGLWADRYTANRLFVMLDGPLAFHSVPFDQADGRPNPKRAIDGGLRARRRVLRSHVAVSKERFFGEHGMDETAYLRIQAPNAALDSWDLTYREAVIRPFYIERMRAYARAVSAPRWAFGAFDALERSRPAPHIRPL